MKNYQQDAIDTLAQMGVKFTTSFIKHGLHFADDKEARDIYRVTFSRNGNRFSLRFGQSLSNTGIAPTAYDVLTCLQKNDPDNFENFCSDFGYDQNSLSAEKIYKAVVKEYAEVNKFFTTEEIETLQEIQ